MANAVILILVIGYCLFLIYKQVQNRKAGKHLGCTGCGGSCGGCSGCSAWINLLDRKRAGEHVNEKDLKKHKYDVFRLLQIVTAGTKVESEGLVTERWVRQRIRQ